MKSLFTALVIAAAFYLGTQYTLTPRASSGQSVARDEGVHTEVELRPGHVERGEEGGGDEHRDTTLASREANQFKWHGA